MPTVLGLTTAKINGIFHLDVRNARWSVKRANPQHVVSDGIRQALGHPIPTGSFDEVIPRERAFPWRSLRDFSIEIYDQETRSIVVASFTGCNWNDLSGSTDQSSATTTKTIAWNGTSVVEA